MTPLEIGSLEAKAIIRAGRIVEVVEADFERLNSIVAACEAVKWPHDYMQQRRRNAAAAQMNITADELTSAVQRIRSERDTGYSQGMLW